MNPGHVYVIDDDPALCASVGNLLTFAGYRVQTWNQAEDFLSQVPNAVPAVVVTDMRMPGTDGLALYEALIAQGRTMPVIYISGESTLEQGIRAMKLGALEFLVKPFTREALLGAVAAGMEKDRQNMQALIEQVRLKETLASLSPREREVHGLLLKGCNNSEIMNAMQVALSTAKQYKAEVMRKLGVRSLSQLIELGVDKSADVKAL